MRSGIQSVAVLLAATANVVTSVGATNTASHPFVGEHKDAGAVHHPSGTISQRMTAKPAAFNKHDQIKGGDGLFEPQDSSWQERATEAMFGKYESQFQSEAREFGEKRSHYEQSKKLGQSGLNFATILKNPDGWMWTGEIYMGKLSKMDVVYDTGSDWLVVEGAVCTNCQGNTYDIQPSLDSGIAQQTSLETSERLYGSAALKGKEYSDTVCILFSACVENFEFFYIEDQKGISEPIDGILGMSRDKPFHIAPDNDKDNGPLYVENLAKAGVIPENKFSFYFTEPGELSWVDLGEPQLDNVKDGTTVESIQLIEEDFFWGTYLEGVAFGDTSDRNSYAFAKLEGHSTWKDNSFYSIIDTGSTAIMLSAVYYESFITQLFARVGDVNWTYEQRSQVVITECTANWPSIYFLMDRRWIEVAAKDYVFDVSEGQDGSQCILFFMPAGIPMNILGMPLFVDYYTIHDPITGEVGWAPHSASNKKTLERGIPSTMQFLEIGQVQSNSAMQEAVIVSWALTVLVGYLIYDLWYQFMRNSWQEALEEWLFITLTALFFAALILMGIFLLQPLMFSLTMSVFFPQPVAEATFRLTQVKQASMLSSLNYDASAILGLGLGVLACVAAKKSGLLTFNTQCKSASTKKVTAAESESDDELSTEQLLEQALKQASNSME